MSEKTWLDYVTAFGAAATPIIVLLLTGLGWRFRNRLERKLLLENNLRADRIATYNTILEPFIILLTPPAAWKEDPETSEKDKDAVFYSKLTSLRYRQSAFQLALVANDAVVKSYSDLMQFFWQCADASATSPPDVKQITSLLGRFLLEVRKSMGNEGTELNNLEMLEWFIKKPPQQQPAR
jgi:hypothetical protein